MVGLTRFVRKKSKKSPKTETKTPVNEEKFETPTAPQEEKVSPNLPNETEMLSTLQLFYVHGSQIVRTTFNTDSYLIIFSFIYPEGRLQQM